MKALPLLKEAQYEVKYERTQRETDLNEQEEERGGYH